MKLTAVAYADGHLEIEEQSKEIVLTCVRAADLSKDVIACSYQRHDLTSPLIASSDIAFRSDMCDPKNIVAIRRLLLAVPAHEQIIRGVLVTLADWRTRLEVADGTLQNDDVHRRIYELINPEEDRE